MPVMAGLGNILSASCKKEVAVCQGNDEKSENLGKNESMAQSLLNAHGEAIDFKIRLTQ